MNLAGLLGVISAASVIYFIVGGSKSASIFMDNTITINRPQHNEELIHQATAALMR